MNIGYDKHYLKQTITHYMENGEVRHITTVDMPTVGYYQGYTQDGEGKYLCWSDSNGNREVFRYQLIGNKKNGEAIYDCIVILSTIRFIFNEMQLSPKEFNKKYLQWLKDKRLDSTMESAIINP